MALPKPLTLIFQYIEENKDKFLDRLRNAISITSVPTKEQQILEMINWTNSILQSLGVETELRNTVDDDYCGSVPLPPIILGSWETKTCPNKATVLIYGQLDVEDAQMEDGWKNEPFELFEEGDRLFGRGIMDKSAIITWINTVEAYKTLGIDCPVNIKFIIESMGSQSSPGLKSILRSEKNKFLGRVDYVCVTKGSWLQPDIPCIIHSLKGICCFSVQVTCASKNLNSNICGGIVQEAMTDLIYLLNSLTDGKGNLNMSCIHLEVEPETEEEEQIYKNANFNFNTFMENIEANCLSHNGNESDILKHRMSLPTLTIHGIDSSFARVNEFGIPGRVIAKLSIRIIHNQTADKVFEGVKNYLEQVWSDYGSSNVIDISFEKSFNPWQEDASHVQHQAGKKAFNYVYKRDPWNLNSGYVIPVLNILSEVIEKNVLLLPVGTGEKFDVNENMNKKNYLDATKVFAAYLYEMGELPKLWTKSSASFVSCKSVTEMCVCGRFGEEIQAASGDAETCVCSDAVAKPTPTPAAKVDEDDGRCLCPSTKQEKLDTQEPKDEKPIVPAPQLIPMKCACLLPAEMSPRPPISEIMSLMSNASAASRNPTVIPELKQKPKKIITPSAETLKCVCVKKEYIPHEEKEPISKEQHEELKKSMISVGSQISGKSAGEFEDHVITPRMAMLGCVCPEKSAETVYEEYKQIDRMLCPIKIKKEGEMCTTRGKRKHHIAGPPPIEEESETSVGPLSHCSCASEESIAVIPLCDCEKRKSDLPYNLDNEVD